MDQAEAEPALHYLNMGVRVVEGHHNETPIDVVVNGAHVSNTIKVIGERVQALLIGLGLVAHIPPSIILAAKDKGDGRKYVLPTDAQVGEILQQYDMEVLNDPPPPLFNRIFVSLDAEPPAG